MSYRWGGQDRCSQTGQLSPDGQLVLRLKPSEQGATKSDVERLAAQLADIRAALSTPG